MPNPKCPAHGDRNFPSLMKELAVVERDCLAGFKWAMHRLPTMYAACAERSKATSVAASLRSFNSCSTTGGSTSTILYRYPANRQVGQANHVLLIRQFGCHSAYIHDDHGRAFSRVCEETGRSRTCNRGRAAQCHQPRLLRRLSCCQSLSKGAGVRSRGSPRGQKLSLLLWQRPG